VFFYFRNTVTFNYKSGKAKGGVGLGFLGSKLVRRLGKHKTHKSSFLFNRGRLFINLPTLLIFLIRESFRLSWFFLFWHSSGVYFYTRNNSLHSKFFLIRFLNKFNFFTPQGGLLLVHMIGFLNTTDSVFSVECLLKNKQIYSLALKSTSLLLSKNTTFGYFLLRLPSRKSILVYFISTVMLSKSIDSCSTSRLPSLVRKFSAGFFRNHSFSSKVRGVAMNPVDHPHGGRTKSILLPKTPWGLVTKKK